MRRAKCLLGLGYIVVSMACSVYYLDILYPYLQNDLFWAGFALLGAQTYLLDLYRVHLWTTSHGSIEVFNVSNALLQTYDTPSTMLEVQPSYPRSLVSNHLTSPRNGIAALRNMPIWAIFQITTQPCYVDVGRRWELAHTQARQNRCSAFAANGAVYLEPALRCVNWAAFYARYGPPFMFSVGDAVLASPGGDTWLESVQDAFVSIENELALWTTHGLSHYTVQWGNIFTTGIHETISITSAFGWEQALSTTKISYASRDALWTTYVLYWYFFNDLWASSIANGSLVRSAHNFMANNSVGPSYSAETIVGLYPYTPCSVIIHDHLGPFASIDMWLVPPPASLQELVSSHTAVVATALQANATLWAAFEQLATVPLDPVPPSWRIPHATYYGGSPICATYTGSTFAQRSFSFEDTCATQVASSIPLETPGQAFAMTALRLLRPNDLLVAGICRQCVGTSARCVDALTATLAVTEPLWPLTAPLLTRLAQDVVADVAALQIEMIQFAIVNGSNNLVLHQPLLKGDFAFFGFLMLFDWVYGYREVVSFQGDVSTMVLMSEPLPSRSMAPSALEVPASTCYYLWYIAVATTVLLVLVALGTIGYTVVGGCRLSGYELFSFNRVAGPVWIGRPMLLIRAVTALVLLSSPSMTFLSDDDIGRFVFVPRSLFHALLISGEATWLTYVLTDVLLVFAPTEAALSAALSSYSVWAITLLLELFWPLQPTFTIDRTCSQRGVVLSLQCTSGTVAFGSLHRILLIVIINGVTSLVSILLVRATASMRVPRRFRMRRASTLSSAAAEAFLELPGDDAWSMDPALGCMMGVFRFSWRHREYIFDSKLWLSFQKSSAGPCMTVVSQPAPSMAHVTVKSRRVAIVKVCLGLCYLLATVGGSLYYLKLSSVNLANDLWWVSFNTSGMQAYVANWFNRYLWLTPSLLDAPLDVQKYADMNSYATNTTTVSITDMLPRRIHFEVASDLALAIHGLRATNPCLLPWVATQYCWADFDKRWAMANSAARQNRCAAKYAANAAVYLEAPLRNTNWDGFETCWGESFESGIAVDMRQEVSGRMWLEATQANANAEDAEVLYWTSKGLASYTTAWQNYKSVGVINTLNVVTALGLSFPFTLQASNGSFHLGTQTSYKMYWNLASDFWALASNGSGVTGTSLLRSSPRFAFANTSLLDVYYRNGSMSAPLDPAYHVFQSNLGAFGSVDLRHIAYPASLAALVRDMHEALRSVLTNTTDGNGTYTAQTAYLDLVTMQGLVAVPSSLNATSQYSAGSNLLCNAILPPWSLSTGLASYFGVTVPCEIVFGEWVYTSKDQILFALVASGIALDSVTRIPSTCEVEMVYPSDCRDMLASISAFLATYFSPAYLQAIRSQAQRVQLEVNALSVELVAYLQDTTTNEMSLFHQRILDNDDVPLQFTGWTNLYDWVLGYREVIVFEADKASLTVMSTAYMPTTFAASAAEVPINVAAYLRVFCQYISFLLLMISLVAILYTVQNRFTSEGLNLFEVNRVGGTVWIGRPLLLLRSVTALCILSTATLQLQVAGKATYLLSARQDVSQFLAICIKVLAAGELGWLVYIVDDIAMVITQQYAASYTFKGSILVWAIAAILSLVAPVAHHVHLELHCTVDSIDYQAVCSSGSVVIGSLSRLLLLVAIALSGSLTMYLHDRLRYDLPPPTEKPSYLLSCGAKYLFEKTGWVHDGVYHVDFASAALTGLLTWRQTDVVHIFDVKTWRVLTVPTAASMYKIGSELRLHGALPLVE